MAYRVTYHCTFTNEDYLYLTNKATSPQDAVDRCKKAHGVDNTGIPIEVKYVEELLVVREEKAVLKFDWKA